MTFYLISQAIAYRTPENDWIETTQREMPDGLFCLPISAAEALPIQRAYVQSLQDIDKRRFRQISPSERRKEYGSPQAYRKAEQRHCREVAKARLRRRKVEAVLAAIEAAIAEEEAYKKTLYKD